MLTVVQSVTGSAASASSLTLTFPSGTTAGNALVVCIGLELASGDGQTVSSVKLGGTSGTFASEVANTGSASGSPSAAIWAEANISGDQTAVLITPSTTCGIVAAAYEVNDIVASAILDKSDNAAATSSTWTSGTSATTVNPNDIIFGCIIYDTAVTITGPSAFTNISQIQIATNPATFMSGYEIVSAVQGAIYNGTSSASEPYACCVVAVKGVNRLAGSVANVSVSAPAGIASAQISASVSTVSSAAGTAAFTAQIAGLVTNNSVSAPDGSISITLVGTVSGIASESSAGTVSISSSAAAVNISSVSLPGTVDIYFSGQMSQVQLSALAGSVQVYSQGTVSQTDITSPSGNAVVEFSGTGSISMAAEPGSVNIELPGNNSLIEVSSPSGSVVNGISVTGSLETGEWSGNIIVSSRGLVQQGWNGTIV
jgi:hypothetical protein